MPEPLLASHKGKIVHLHPDGRRTYEDGTPVIDVAEKLQAAPPRRWHDPYS
jgi:hypothetical protein